MFYSQKSQQIFLFSFKNISLEDHFLLKHFFSNFNLCITSFYKILPNFLMNNSQHTMVSFEHVDFRPKIFNFRTLHLWNSTTELILVNMEQCKLDFPQIGGCILWSSSRHDFHEFSEYGSTNFFYQICSTLGVSPSLVSRWREGYRFWSSWGP